MNSLFVLLFTFGIVFLAELGDKSQLMTISLASKYHYHPVFWGIFLGMGVITVIGVGVGTILYQIIPVFYLKVIAALIFLVFGILSFIKEERIEKKGVKKKKVFTTSFFLAMIAELGDKTQLVVIALTARFQNPYFVFIGAITALGVVIAAGVFLGTKLTQFVEKDKIDFIVSALFIILGVAFLVELFLL